MEAKTTALKTLRIFYIALLAGLVIFAGISFFISRISEPIIMDEEMSGHLLKVSLFIAVLCVAIAGNRFKKELALAKNRQTLAEKFDYYRAAAIKSYALIEGPALFAIVCFFLTYNIRELVLAGLLMLSYLSRYPSAARIASQLEVSQEDIESL